MEKLNTEHHNPLLETRRLTTEFQSDEGNVRAVDRLSFSIYPGETLGIVGESGCGKTATALSLLKLIPHPSGKILEGEVIFQNEDLLNMSNEALQKIRGKEISMVFQEPMTALNPVHTIGKQVCEPLLLHKGLSKADAWAEACNLLSRVGIGSPETRMHEYPHQLSGGMRQRVSIAMALACKPKLLIADEPTTALDVTIQAQILELLQSIQKEYGMALMFITHDLGVVAELCDRVIVMYGGKIVEEALVNDLFEHPKHPYTQGLLKSMPSLDSKNKARLPTIKGQASDYQLIKDGCPFENRCYHARAQCKELTPHLESVNDQHHVRCLRWNEINSKALTEDRELLYT
ncbi:MAG TPA: peptide ABC transporter ATP-binding protein [Opitutae bacterium]|nr:peptide ABC transporter ATP-binding protein [Opitutae bacterium]|tara:strand:- start:280 stop:1320 length:1041 start_codon:yes stop_codon:yes gene_type:complete